MKNKSPSSRAPHKLQIARRTVQILALVVALTIPIVSRYANYISARELDKNLARFEGTAQGRALALLDTTFRAMPDGETERVGRIIRNRDVILARTQGFGGGPWSGQIAGVSMTDPLAAAEAIVAHKRLPWVLVVSLVVPILGTLLLGRVFCSWICPMGFLFDLGDKLRSLAGLLELRPLNIRFPRWTMYALLGAGLGLAFLSAEPVLSYVYPPAMFTREAHGFVFANFDRAEEGSLGLNFGGLTSISIILGGIMLFEAAISRRWWCRYVCPGGALYSLIGAARPVRVRLVEDRCTKCALCVPVCPMGLNPMHNEMGMACDCCGV